MDLKDWLQSNWDRALAVAALAIGALALFLGYRGTSDALHPGQQIPYVISGGLLGIFAVGVSAALWLSADLRDEWHKLDDLDRKLDRLLETATTTSKAQAAVVDTDEPGPVPRNGDAPSHSRRASRTR